MSFVKAFHDRTGKAPDYLAAQMYDAVTLLAEAIRKSGPDRMAIIEALKEMSPWQGVTGIIQWDRLGRNQRPVLLGTIRNGRIQPISNRSGNLIFEFYSLIDFCILIFDLIDHPVRVDILSSAKAESILF